MTILAADRRPHLPDSEPADALAPLDALELAAREAGFDALLIYPSLCDADGGTRVVQLVKKTPRAQEPDRADDAPTETAEAQCLRLLGTVEEIRKQADLGRVDPAQAGLALARIAAACWIAQRPVKRPEADFVARVVPFVGGDRDAVIRRAVEWIAGREGRHV